MFFETYITEQIARDRRNERMAEALRENRWQQARQALRIAAKTVKGR